MLSTRSIPVATIVLKLLVTENGLLPPLFFARTRQKYVVLSESGPTARDVVVNAVSISTNVANVELVESCSWYDTAPAEAFHCSVVFNGMSIAPSAGETSVGAGGGAMAAAVVNLNGDENGPLPATFVALTRQKYVVLFANPAAVTEVPDTFVFSKTSVENEVSAETCAWYDDAPGAADQVRVGFSGILAAPSSGEIKTGAVGITATVVNLLAGEKELVPSALLALTCQKYVVLFASPGNVSKLTVMPPVSTTIEVKSTLVDTCTR